MSDFGTEHTGNKRRKEARVSEREKERRGTGAGAEWGGWPEGAGGWGAGGGVLDCSLV